MKLPKFTSYPFRYIGAAIFALASCTFLFEMLDKKGLDPKYTVTHVAGRHYRPQSEDTRVRASSNSVRTYKRVIPQAWSVKVEVDGIPGWAEVPRYEYERMKEGTEVEVVYARNRIRKALTITTLRLKKPIE
jgi:hypothetical protein